MEMKEMPMFRRVSPYTAFVEGWGLYSESLGYDLGLYKDPYSQFGQLTYDMWRAVRLVVDTGMHYYEWDRQRAIDFFLENAGKSELDIINEIDRYIVMPGQALAYKIGQMKFLSLKEKTKIELGVNYDVRDFHDVVLSHGALPLNELDLIIEGYIYENKKRFAFFSDLENLTTTYNSKYKDISNRTSTKKFLRNLLTIVAH